MHRRETRKRRYSMKWTALRCAGVAMLALSVWCGALAVSWVFLGWRSVDGLVSVPGQIVAVERHMHTPGAKGFNTEVFEVVFSYPINGALHVSDTFSPLCHHCAPDDIRRVTGLHPRDLKPGTPVQVFVNPGRGSPAYLAIPGGADWAGQLAHGLLFLLGGPAFVWIFVAVWEQADE